ncbi:hypothetical protein AMTRI_Chr09g37360 [Amborella trichopoda]
MVLIRKRQSHLPPGPKGLPMVGCRHRLGSRPHETLATFAEIHGSLMTLQLGFVTTIVVSSSKMAKECTAIEAMKIKSHHNRSLVWAQMGPRWQALRRLCNTQLFTPQWKVHEIVELIRQTEQVVDIGRVAFVIALNLVSNMIFSTEMDVIWSIMEVSGVPNHADYFPINKLFERLHQLLNVIIDERIQSREKGGVAKGDFIGIILDSNQENGVEFRQNEILALLTLFTVGSDTSSTSVEWAMAELLHNPDKMAMAKMELSRTLGGPQHIVEESDISRLPYLQVVVKETWWLHAPVPLLIPHRADTTVNVAGYIVSEHAQVLINYWAIGRDPKVFLGSNVDYKGNDFQFILFGARRRTCPGLPLGVHMVHLMLTSLLHYFDWELPDGLKAEEMDMRDKFGVTLQKLVPLRLIPRQGS